MDEPWNIMLSDKQASHTKLCTLWFHPWNVHNREIHRYKFSGCQRLETIMKVCRMTANGYGASCGGDRMFQNWWMVVKLCEYPKKTPWLQHFKQVYCKVSKLYLSKGVILF